MLVALAGFASWLISTAAAGGGEFIFISAVALLLGGRAVAPVVTLGNLFAVPSRIVIFRKTIDWKIVRWFLAGAVPGGLLGAWVFAHTRVQWLQIVVALFLLSAPLQYRFGERERSFRARLWWFLPAGLVVAFLSGLIGGMGPVLNPLYLNYGTVKGEMVGTKSVNSSAPKVHGLALIAAREQERALWVERDAPRALATVLPRTRHRVGVQVDGDRRVLPQIRVAAVASGVDHERLRPACQTAHCGVDHDQQAPSAIAREEESASFVGGGRALSLTAGGVVAAGSSSNWRWSTRCSRRGPATRRN